MFCVSNFFKVGVAQLAIIVFFVSLIDLLVIHLS